MFFAERKSILVKLYFAFCSHRRTFAGVFKNNFSYAQIFIFFIFLFFYFFIFSQRSWLHDGWQRQDL
jgi:hypothetical protein